MNCDCGGKTTVIDSREIIDPVGVVNIRRRRECRECGERFSTIEADYDLIKKLLKVNRLFVEGN